MKARVNTGRKLGAFAGYFAAMGASTGLWMMFAAVVSAHPILSAPLAVAGSLAGVIGVLGSCIRLIVVAEDGWDAVVPERECRGCDGLRRENAQLLEAIK